MKRSFFKFGTSELRLSLILKQIMIRLIALRYFRAEPCRWNALLYKAALLTKRLRELVHEIFGFQSELFSVDDESQSSNFFSRALYIPIKFVDNITERWLNGRRVSYEWGSRVDHNQALLGIFDLLADIEVLSINFNVV